MSRILGFACAAFIAGWAVAGLMCQPAYAIEFLSDRQMESLRGSSLFHEDCNTTSSCPKPCQKFAPLDDYGICIPIDKPECGYDPELWEACFHMVPGCICCHWISYDKDPECSGEGTETEQYNKQQGCKEAGCRTEEG